VELRHLRYFVAVAEEGSFSLGATRIHIAQPPLSQQIRQLESELGAVLFERKNRPLRITAAGAYLLERATAILSEVDRLAENAQRAARGQLATFTIGHVESAMYVPFPEILKRFRSKHPDVDVVLLNSSGVDQVNLVTSEKVNVFFGRVLHHQSVLAFEPVIEEQLVAAIAHGHPLTKKTTVTAAELGCEPLVLYPRRHHSAYARMVISSIEESGKQKVHVSQESDHLHTALGLVAAGFGVAIVPESIQKVRVKGVVYRRMRGQRRLSAGVLYRKDDSSPLVRDFLEESRRWRSAR